MSILTIIGILASILLIVHFWTDELDHYEWYKRMFNKDFPPGDLVDWLVASKEQRIEWLTYLIDNGYKDKMSDALYEMALEYYLIPEAHTKTLLQESIDDAISLRDIALSRVVNTINSEFSQDSLENGVKSKPIIGYSTPYGPAPTSTYRIIPPEPRPPMPRTILFH